MRNTIKITGAVAVAAALTVALSACSAPSDPDTNKTGDANAPLVVGATSVPQGQILEYIGKELAPKRDLKIKVQIYDDYELVNPATQDGSLDANYFQTKEYLDLSNKKSGGDIVPVVNVHVEPMGLYSKKHEKLTELKAGAVVGIPSDASNAGRALELLDKEGVIKLKDGAPAVPGLNDIADDKGIKITETKADALTTALPDFDAAAINGNYAVAGKLSPKKDALAVESSEDSPYANFLAVKKEKADDPRVEKLAALLNSDEVKKYIEDNYKDGSVLPSFGKSKS